MNSNDSYQLKMKGFKRIWRAAGYSWDGLKAAYTTEEAFRQEVWLSILLIPIVLIMPISYLFKAFLIACIFFVFMAELFNSAIEAVSDKVKFVNIAGNFPSDGLRAAERWWFV